MPVDAAVVEQHNMLRMSSPSQCDLRHVQQYLESLDMGALGFIRTRSRGMGIHRQTTQPRE